MHWLQFPPEKPNTQVHSPGSYSIVSYTCLQNYKKKNCILCSSVADPGCLSLIPDQIFFHPGSRIRTLFPSQIRIKEFKYFNPEKWFLSSRKYDPGCSSWILDPFPDFLPLPDPGSRIQWSKRHRIPDPDPQHCFVHIVKDLNLYWGRKICKIKELERCGHSSDCKPYSSLGTLQNRPVHRRTDPEKGSTVVQYILYLKGKYQNNGNFFEGKKLKQYDTFGCAVKVFKVFQGLLAIIFKCKLFSLLLWNSWCRY